jgi:WD40 repeat protein/tRNA A-37 threonylcarbamoyl transferase component Bud32
MRVGPYKLLQQIGEGGMGVVYMAEQEQPVRRRVAVKVVKPGMDSKQVIARFEAERQALSMMDHPHIARVLDAGTTDTGRPYFVMELVHGVPITRYCDENRLTPRERLELFVPVCQAIQHAHQKGIIHRDLKPSNVLITLYDGKPVPKVIDFGVAKAVEQRLTEKTMFTQYGSIVGTFEYMSPEQAEMSGLGVDTRSDIYSLGVVLYELLTGSTPISRKQFKEAGYSEMVRIIKEEEPPRPSTRLSTTEELATIAARRKTEPARLARLVRGELDWIVMKCLEKDRTRRYDTANGLARDVQRYLADEPVEACPPSAGYRLRKYARRYKKALVTATAFVLLLLLGALVSAWLAVRARVAEAAAEERRDAAENAERKAKEEREATEKERLRAERNEEKAQHSLYIANMHRVRFELEHNNIRRARELLDLYRHPKTPGKDLRGWEWYYLDRTSQGELYTLEGHKGRVVGVAFSPDGSLLASAGGEPDPTIKLWDTVTGKEVRSLTGIKPPVSMVAFSPDGRLLACRWGLGTGAAVTLWDATTGKEIRTLKPEGATALGLKPGPTSAFGPVAFSPDWKALAVAVSEGPKRSIKFWDLGAEKWQGSIPLDTNPSRLSYSPDGKLLAEASSEGARLWDVARRARLHTFTGHFFADVEGLTHVSEAITALAFSPDGRILATCGRDGTARLHDVRSGKHLRSLTALAAGVTRAHSGLTDLTFSPDGSSLITAGVQGSLKSWEVRTGREERSLPGHSEDVLCVAVSPDGTRLASGSTAGEIKVWDATAGPTEVFSLGKAYRAFRSTFSPDGKMVAHTALTPRTTRRGPEVRYLDHARAGLVLDSGGVFAFSPNSQTLGTAAYRTDPESGKAVQEFTCWDLETGRVERSFPGPGHRIRRLAFSPDGKTLASSSVPEKNQGVVKLWDVATGKEQKSFPATSIAFTPDGRTLALVGNDQVLRLVDPGSGRELLHLKGRGTARFVTFSKDGKSLFFDGVVWETTSGRPICRLEGMNPQAYFSPDGTRLFSLTPSLPPGGLLRVWDAATGELLLATKVPGGSGLEVHPDGWRCAVSHPDVGTWLVDARPPTPELRQRRQAHNLVAYFFGRPMVKEDVLSLLGKLKTISEPVRQEALALAQQLEHDLWLLNMKSTAIVIQSDRTPEEYLRALKWAEEAHRLAPEIGPVVNTLGLALYRAGRYKEAVAVLERSRQLNLKSSREDHFAYDLLFLAMTQWKLGRHEEARATLRQARDPKSHPGYVLSRHWQEGEALIGKADGSKE